MTIFTTTFWADTAERAIKTVAQSILSLWLVADQLLNILTVDWVQTAGVALGAGAISVLTSIVSASITSNDSASLAVKSVPKG